MKKIYLMLLFLGCYVLFGCGINEEEAAEAHKRTLQTFINENYDMICEAAKELDYLTLDEVFESRWEYDLFSIDEFDELAKDLDYVNLDSFKNSSSDYGYVSWDELTKMLISNNAYGALDQIRMLYGDTKVLGKYVIDSRSFTLHKVNCNAVNNIKSENLLFPDINSNEKNKLNFHNCVDEAEYKFYTGK